MLHSGHIAMLTSQNGLDNVVKAFTAKIQELQELTLLRVDSKSIQRLLHPKALMTHLACGDHLVSGSLKKPVQMMLSADASKDINTQELAALDASVQAIEQKLREIQQFIQQEKQAVTKARALISACSLQRDQLQYISTHLPARLPEASCVSNQVARQVSGPLAPSKEYVGEEANTDENSDTTNVETQPAAAKQAATDKRKRPRAPRRSVSTAVWLAHVTTAAACRFHQRTTNADLSVCFLQV